MRIVLVEDESLTLASLSLALNASGIEVAASVNTAAAAVNAIRDFDPEVVVLDIDLGTGPTGLDLADVLSRQKPLLGILLLTSATDPRLVRSSLPEVPSNAVYLVKSAVTDITVLTDAINQAYDQAQLGPLTTTKVSQKVDDLSLTDIQMETLRLVAQGHSNSEIARQRFVAEKTVEQTIAKIAQSLGIKQTSSANQRVHIARMYFRMRGQG
jgi:DNA-binding NarL/FixJ family response regulator